MHQKIGMVLEETHIITNLEGGKLLIRKRF